MKRRSHFFILLSFFIIIVIVNPCIFGGAGPSWWNDEWQYRTPIIINNVDGPSLTNVPIQLDIPLRTGMQSDFDDIRFVMHPSTVLSYFLEEVITQPESSLLNWEMYGGNPIITNDTAWEGDNIGSPYLFSWNSTHDAVAYVGDVGASKEFGYTYSTDGSTWTKYSSNPFFTTIAGELSVDDPMIIQFNSTHYAMYFISDPTNPADETSFHVAFSTDRLSWTRYGDNPIIGPFSNNIWQPYVFKDYNSTHWALYYGNSTGAATANIVVCFSTDGLSWSGHQVVLNPRTGYVWDAESVLAPRVTKIGSTFYMLYTGKRTGRQWSIGLATSSNGISFTRHNYNPIISHSFNTSLWNGVRTSFGQIYDWNSTHYALIFGGAKDEDNYFKTGIAFTEKVTIARVWVKFPVIEADTQYTSANTSYHLYYENSRASSQSDGGSTFIFFDDFNDGFDTNEWNSSGTVSASGGVCTISSNSWIKVGNPAINYSRPLQVVSRLKLSTENPVNSKMSIIKDTNNRVEFAIDSGYADRWIVRSTASGSGTAYQRRTDWTNFQTYWIGWDATTKWSRSYLDEVEHSSNINSEDSVVLFQVASGSTNMTLDWVAVGKYDDALPAPLLGATQIVPPADDPEDSMMQQYLMVGDISGYIIAQYTSIMGTLFFVFILMPPVLGTYIRAGVMPAMIVMFLCWGVIYTVFPGLGLNLVIILLALAAGLYLASLFLGRRTSI